MSLLEEIRIVVLCTYVCISGLLLIFSISRRLQVRDVVHSSRYGLTKTVIAGGCVLTPVVLILAIPSLMDSLSTPHIVAYALGSSSLLAGRAIDDSLMITRHGLVFPSTTYPSRLGWNQVTDYFVRHRNWRQRFTIIWKDEDGVFRRFQFYTSRKMAERIDEAVEAHFDSRSPVRTEGQKVSSI